MAGIVSQVVDIKTASTYKYRKERKIAAKFAKYFLAFFAATLRSPLFAVLLRQDNTAYLFNAALYALRHLSLANSCSTIGRGYVSSSNSGTHFLI